MGRAEGLLSTYESFHEILQETRPRERIKLCLCGILLYLGLLNL